MTVEATDDDNHGVTYSIEGESHSYFALDPSSGVVTVDHELDRESMDLIEFDVSFDYFIFAQPILQNVFPSPYANRVLLCIIHPFGKISV